MLSMVTNATVVNTVMIPSDMVCVLILDVLVVIAALEINNRYVEEVWLSPSIQSESRKTVYRVRKVKPGAALCWFYHLMQI